MALEARNRWEGTLVDLDAAAGLPLADVGAKAQRLALLRGKGLPVLPGFVVRAGTLDLCVAEAGVDEEWRKAKAAPALYRYQLFRNLVQRLVLPDGLVALLAARAAGLGPLLAVRSSGAMEDAPSRSLAGFFHSEVDVAPAGVAEAVRTCWASGFTELAARYGGLSGGLPVLVQPTVRPEKSGVFFSRDPLGLAADAGGAPGGAGIGSVGAEGAHGPGAGRGWVVEAVAGHPGALVSGSVTPVRYTQGGEKGEGERPGGEPGRPGGPEGPGKPEGLGKPGGRPEELLTAEELALVGRTGCRAAEACGWDADVEWALAGGRLWVLQARPVTTRPERQGGPPRKLPYLVDVDDPETCAREDLGRCRSLHLRWYDKHHWIRMAARRRGCTVADAAYLFFRPDTLTFEELDSLAFPGPCVKVSDGKRIRTFGRRLLLPFLKTVPPRPDGVAVVKLEYVSLTEMCGFARRLPDGGTFIEVLRGAFGGFRFDRLPFTVYQLDPAGRVVRHEPQTYTRIWAFDEAAGTFAPQEVPPCRADLIPDQLDHIRRMADAMSEEFGTVTVEWVLEGDRLDLFDLTLESGAMNLSRYPAGTMSPGKAEGQVVILRDISLLKKTLPSRSVIPEPEYFDALRSPETRAVLREALGEVRRPVVVTEYPDPSLSLLVGVAAGFIFERGATLCHLAIILREERVPAVILPGALSALRQGAWAIIDDGRVTTR